MFIAFVAMTTIITGMDPQLVNEQRHKKRLVELRHQLKTLEQDQLKLEAKGIQLERQLRSKVRQQVTRTVCERLSIIHVYMCVCLFVHRMLTWTIM